jgi:NAD-dependent deacetylase
LIPDDLIAHLTHAKSLVVLTGAGISAESGIPTFRDAQTGLWSKFNPAELASMQGFLQNPAKVTEWYDLRRMACAEARPNPAHIALAELEKYFEGKGKRFSLVTQNVDRLHQKAGSKNILEYHGTLWIWSCVACFQEISLEGREAFQHYPPACDCGGLLRPNVVWFGEFIPDHVLHETIARMRDCQFFFSAGTSSVIQPAAGLAWEAKRNGAKVVEINLEPTPVSEFADWSFYGRAAEILPELVQKLT